MRTLLIILFLLVVSITSCSKRSAQMDKEARDVIDSISTERINVLRPELDSLCDIWFDSLVTVAMDSIMEVRQMERQIIISK